MVPVEEKGNVWTLHGHFVPFSGGANGKWSGEVVWMVQPEGLASLFFVISGLGKKPWARTVSSSILSFVLGAMWCRLWWCHVSQTSMSIFACNHLLLYNVVISVVAVCFSCRIAVFQ